MDSQFFNPVAITFCAANVDGNEFSILVPIGIGHSTFVDTLWTCTVHLVSLSQTCICFR